MSRDLMVSLSDEEDAVLAEVLRRGGFPNEQAIVKLGIYKVSTHFDIAMSDDCLNTPYNSSMRPLLDAIRREVHRPYDTPLLDDDDRERPACDRA